jgi:predicted secreted acid phosphatase
VRHILKKFIREKAKSHQLLLETEARKAGVLLAGEMLTFSIHFKPVPIVAEVKKPKRERHRLKYSPEELSLEDFSKIKKKAKLSPRPAELLKIFEKAKGKRVPITAIEAGAFPNSFFGSYCEGLNSAFRKHRLNYRAKEAGRIDGVTQFRIFKVSIVKN